jgi:hypothetical protein
VIGLDSVISSSVKVISWAHGILRRPKLLFWPFDWATDLQHWDVYDSESGAFLRTQKVFTINVRNVGKSVARRCIGFMDVNRSGDSSANIKRYALHWADETYKFRTSGAGSIDLGPEGRRLDVVFTFKDQQTIGCWVATPASLTSPKLSPDFLPAGEYEAEIEIHAENAAIISAKFRIVSPLDWHGLEVVPLQ